MQTVPHLLLAGLLASMLAALAAAPGVAAAGAPEAAPGWDPGKAAQYLDDRMDWWFEKAAKLRTGDTPASCVSCHMSVPYMLARPGLRKAMRVSDPVPQETKLLGEIARRVEAGEGRAPMYAGQAAASRGTEAVLIALIMARADAGRNLEPPSAVTRQAFRQLWEQQREDGAWDWLDFALEPNPQP